MTRHIRVALGIFALLATTVSVGVGQTSTADLLTFDGKDGQRYFALSLQPSAQLPAAAARDVIVLVDTSASQTGAYRTDGFEAVETLLESLPKNSRVQLAAIDLDFVPITKTFASPKQAKQGLAKLHQRTPLGSTDMVTGLQGAAKQFQRGSDVARHIVYIGDGISHADLLSKQQFAQLAEQLSGQQITVSTYAIGPQRNVHLLVALANQTGGQVFVDAANVSGQQGGAAMAKSVASPVVWLTDAGLDQLGSQRFPTRLPPLRQDRDSIVIGSMKQDATNLPNDVQLSGTANGRPVQLAWKLTVHPSSDDYSFLPRLVEMAKEDGGASLPTLSVEALQEIRRLMVAGSSNLSEMGSQAYASGNLRGAQLLADEALRQDPANPEAAALQRVVAKSTDTLPVQNEAPLQLGPATDDAPLDLTAESPSGLLDEAMETRRVNNEFVKSEVARGLDDIRRLLRTDPNSAIVELKSLRESIRQAPDLDAAIRNRLVDRIDTSLRQANSRKVQKDHLDSMLRQRQAQDMERQRLLDLARRDDDLIRTYIEQFNSRMDERRFDLATEVAERAYEINPRLEATESVHVKGQIATAYARNIELRERRQQAVLDTLFAVDESHIPFNDNEPLIYPDAQTWENLTNSRKKYAQVDFSTTNKAEERIMEELSKPTKMDFFEEPLSDALSYLETYHGIQIEVSQLRLDELGISTDTPVTKELSGITLRSALKLLLGDLGLTYVVGDEVLQITTTEDAEAQTVTKVYPVADLVLPIQSVGGGMMGGGMMGGGMGGGMMGGGMGGGMMGGGMGGGMMGGMGGMGGGMGGMGGGFFDVADEVSLDSVKSTSIEIAPSKPKMIEVDAQEGDLSGAWDTYFQQPLESIDEASLRLTLRNKMSARKIDEVVVILQSALRNGYVRPWMYEALSLAMQANQAPKSEIERAIMSAVDLTDNVEEIMMAAVYLSKNGFKSRALKMFREVADANPLRPEPFIQGLELASELNDVEGVQWAVTNILSQAWPKEQKHYQDKAIRMAQGTLKQLMNSAADEAQEFRQAISDAIVRDCEVTVSWTGEADLDAMVEEPGGTVCSLRNVRTTSGGVLLGDSFAHDSSGSEPISETYVCPKGFSGRYRVLVRRIWGEVTAGKVTVDVYINRHTPDEKHIRKQIPLSDKDALIVFDVENGRRTESLEEQQVASVVNAQATLNRSILAQRLNQVTESEAVTNLAIARARAGGRRGRLPLLRNRGAVGFRPELTLLPEGANLIAATAVISADRRYVRFSGLPLFSTIGEVQTFNFFTGDTGTDGGGIGGGGGGLGGGLGGGF